MKPQGNVISSFKLGKCAVRSGTLELYVMCGTSQMFPTASTLPHLLLKSIYCVCNVAALTILLNQLIYFLMQRTEAGGVTQHVTFCNSGKPICTLLHTLLLIPLPSAERGVRLGSRQLGYKIIKLYVSGTRGGGKGGQSCLITFCSRAAAKAKQSLSPAWPRTATRLGSACM